MLDQEYKNKFICALKRHFILKHFFCVGCFCVVESFPSFSLSYQFLYWVVAGRNSANLCLPYSVLLQAAAFRAHPFSLGRATL